jgi:hypothetical protein
MRSTNMADLKAAKTEWSSKLLKVAPTGARTELLAKNPTLASRGAIRAITPNPAGNVVGVGIGEKLVDGKHTGVWAVKFFVRMKYAQSQLESRYLLPKQIAGLPVDVEETGLLQRFARARKVRAQDVAIPNPRNKIRPAPPGSSVGFQDPSNQFVMAGTFGALVSDGSGSYILSNNHVLADEDRLPTGAPIFQPGLLDNGNAATDQIAQFTRAINLKASANNQVDCALAKVLSPSSVTNQILQIGAPAGVADAQIDMTVHKFGRTSSYSVGQVTSTDTDVTVQYETGSYTFTGQVIVVGLNGQAFSAAGDSGSLILDRATNNAVALLFAGSDSHTIANHIGDVLQELKVKLA